MSSPTFRTPKGVHDVLPEDHQYFTYIKKSVRHRALFTGGNVRAALLATDVPTDGGSDPRRAPIRNTSLTIVQVNGAGLQATLIADASHLDGQTPDLVAVNDDEQR